MLKEFRPAILFLVKFGVVFGLLSGVYSYWIKTFKGEPDPITQLVSDHTVKVMTWMGFDVHQEPTVEESSSTIFIDGNSAVRVFEGCNGIAVFILFIAFIFAFRASWNTAMYAVFGGLVIHFFNLFRIGGLAWIAVFRPEYMYFTHKYLFTLILYAVVFGLWVIYVRKWGREVKKRT